MLCPFCIIPSLIFLFLVVFLSITLIVTYSKALWHMRSAWDVQVSSPVTLGHWGIVLWTSSGEQTERSLWHMKWKEFKMQKGLIAEHSFDLTVLTKKLLKHHIERQAEDILTWMKRWQQTFFYGCSNIVRMVKSAFCACVKMTWNLEQTYHRFEIVCVRLFYWPASQFCHWGTWENSFNLWP